MNYAEEVGEFKNDAKFLNFTKVKEKKYKRKLLTINF